MTARWIRSIVRVSVALAIVAAIAGQIQNLADTDQLIVENFFSFFTIQSNVLGCLVLLGLEMSRTTLLGRFARWARGATTLYMTMTGIIYALLLGPIAADVSTQLEWVNIILHVVAPIVVLVDWVTAPPTRRPTPTHAAWWLTFPAAWLVYSFVRGDLIGWYPYPFLDPRPGTPHAAGSWMAVGATLGVLTIGVGVLALLIRWLVAMRGVGAHQREQ